MKKGIRKKIARDFDISQSQLVTWMETLTYIRNVCAHHGRLWNRELSLKPELRSEWIKDGASNSKVYCVCLVLQHILGHASPRSRRKDMLMVSILKSPHINVTAMGFPQNWKELAPWNVSLMR